MRVGVPTEIKVHEYRVGLTPSAVREYVARGHKVLVQSGAGVFDDDLDAVAFGSSDRLPRRLVQRLEESVRARLEVDHVCAPFDRDGAVAGGGPPVHVVTRVDPDRHACSPKRFEIVDHCSDDARILVAAEQAAHPPGVRG